MTLAVLAACLQPRTDHLEVRIDELRREIGELNRQTVELVRILETTPPPTAAVRVDNDPPGFDRTRRLPWGHGTRPDVILLSIDTLRADHLGLYGYGRDTSPFLDELAATGTVYDQAWAPSPWTLPSHTTLLSGQLPLHHGVVEDHITIPTDVPLLQEGFADAGYNTAGIVATLFVSSRHGFHRGFDHFEDFGVVTKKINNLSTVDADHVFHQGLHWAQQQPDGVPLFLFLHVYDAHYNYDPPPPWNERFDRKPAWADPRYRDYDHYRKHGLVANDDLQHQIAQYDEEIAYVDAMFRELVETWRKSGRSLLLVVTADHGEEFGERGSWGHAHTLWPEQLHVPLLVNGPGVRVQRVADRIGTEDVAETLADIAGVRFDGPDGRSRARQVRTGVRFPDADLSARFAETSRFDTRMWRWHEGVFDLNVDLRAGKRELCDRLADPACTENVYRAHKAHGDEMFGRLLAYYGEPWQAERSGRLLADDGVVLTGGARKKPGTAVQVTAGQRFGVYPGDTHVALELLDGRAGPWRPLGGTAPGRGCALTYDGRVLVDAEIEDRTDEEIAQLEAIGYVGAEPGDGGPSGRVDCL